MQDVPESPEERQIHRRARRWKRRARILGPFLGIPLLLATLSLSVDLVEYQPQEEKDRLSDQPIRMDARTVDARTSPSSSSTHSTRPGLIEELPAPTAIPLEREALSRTHVESGDLDLLTPGSKSDRRDTPRRPKTLYATPLR